MNGKINLTQLFAEQIKFQEKILEGSNRPSFQIPCDDTENFKYHCLAMVEEMGEVMKADKRWKTHRNERFEPEEKLDEIADVFITLMNICIYSDIDANKLSEAVSQKINQNNERLFNKE